MLVFKTSAFNRSATSPKIFSFGNSRIGGDFDDYLASRPGGIDSRELRLALTPAGRFRAP